MNKIDPGVQYIDLMNYPFEIIRLNEPIEKVVSEELINKIFNNKIIYIKNLKLSGYVVNTISGVLACSRSANVIKMTNITLSASNLDIVGIVFNKNNNTITVTCNILQLSTPMTLEATPDMYDEPVMKVKPIKDGIK